MNIPWIMAAALGLTAAATAQGAPPPSATASGDPDQPPAITFSDDSLELILYASHPEVVTPTGLAVDPAGALYVAETHTHFRPDGYEGPKGDRILRLSGSGDDGRAQSIEVFYEGEEGKGGGLTATMDIEWGPAPEADWLYIAERSAVFRVRDTDGDGRADEREAIVTLETEGNYPHNGISGLSFDAAGFLVFGLGENLGKPYKMIGSDGGSIEGGGEGGSIWSCEANGSEIRREATGLWNPFGTTIDAAGNVFCIDNDPGERPPNRLLNIVWGGDYGFKFRYGRGGHHLFQCWDGELPGTLPMVSAVGEASCAVLPIDDRVLHPDHAGKLLVTSWADHRLELYTLTPRGGSFGADREIIAQGDMGFRPVGLVVGPEGEIFVSDWAFGSYESHGRGRIWKLQQKGGGQVEAEGEPAAGRIPVPPLRPIINRTRDNYKAMSFGNLMDLATHDDAFVRHRGLQALGARIADGIDFPDEGIMAAEQRVALIQAARRAHFEQPLSLMRTMLRDPSAEVRFEALRWIADTGAADLRDDVEEGLSDHRLDHRLFQAHFATLAAIDGEPDRGMKDYPKLWRMVEDEDLRDRVRALALRSLPERHARLTPAALSTLIWRSTADELRAEAIAHLGARMGDPEAQKVLWAVASDHNLPDEQRADAIAHLIPDPAKADVVTGLIEEGGGLRTEAERLLGRIDGSRRAGGGLPSPDDLASWEARIDTVFGRPNVDAGRRLFFNRSLTLCANCHQYAGRGRRVGPDLSHISARNDRRWLLGFLLSPSAEISPTYSPWAIETSDGRTHHGYALRLGGPKEVYMGADGEEFLLKKGDILSKSQTDISMMPPGLPALLTAEELRDLIAFLLWDGE